MRRYIQLVVSALVKLEYSTVVSASMRITEYVNTTTSITLLLQFVVYYSQSFSYTAICRLLYTAISPIIVSANT